MKLKQLPASLRVNDRVRVIRTGWRGCEGIVKGIFLDLGSVLLTLDGGHRIAFKFTQIEPIGNPLPKGVRLDIFCKCIKGRNDGAFTKGKAYKVKSLYQDGDGDFMVEVIDNLGWTVQAKAVRFAIATPSLV